jgi:hypothetical protein
LHIGKEILSHIQGNSSCCKDNLEKIEGRLNGL